MNIKEKIGQLIISRPRAKNIEENIRKGIVGGLYIPPKCDIEHIKELKYSKEIPLLICADLECGELSGCLEWPCALAAAKSGEEGVYKWAYSQAVEAKHACVDAVFGPVFDIVFTRDGIATGFRPLGEDPQTVAKLGYQAVKGYQDGGLLTFCKHYPGFGRAEDDAHISLSSINVSKEEFYENDFLPYMKSAYQNPYLSGVMSGHISIPCIDDIPSPMSKKIVDVLRDNGFEGLLITDSLAMKSIQFYYPMEKLYAGALKSGHDMILVDYNTDDEEGFEWIYKAYKDGYLTEDEIDYKVSRILKTKKYLSEFASSKPNFEKEQKVFTSISKNSIEAGEPIDNTKSTLFVIADERAENVQGEVAFSNKGTNEWQSLIKENFKNSDIMLIDICPSADKIADVLYEGLKHDQVVFIAHAPVKAYAGTSHYHKPLISLVDGMKKKTGAFIIWGNPFAGDDLPTGINKFTCYDFGEFAKSTFEKLIKKE